MSGFEAPDASLKVLR